MAKVIHCRFPEVVIATLEELQWWDMPEEKHKEHIALFQKENVTVEELEKHLSKYMEGRQKARELMVHG